MANIIKQFKDTSGNNVYPIAYAQGGMKMDLLWTNPSPTSSFSGQTVSIDLSEYDFVYITGLQLNTNSVGYDSDLTRVGDKGILWSFVSGYTSHRMYSVGTSGIAFENGSRQTAIGTNADNNGHCIPTNIYGIKMSYVVPTTVHGLQYVEVE